MKPMLAHSVKLSEVDRLIVDDQWWAQQKLDGDRLMIHVENQKVAVVNRNGELYRNPVPRRVVREFEVLDGEWDFDGELLDDGTFWLFDLPFANYQVLPQTSFETRSVILEGLFVRWHPAPCVRLLPTARGAVEKRALFDRLQAQGGEGVIFKRVDGHYVGGRRSQAMLKAKFTATADCVVTAVRPDGRENCTLGLFDDGTVVPVGSVSLIGRPAVSVGDVIEVRYLYAGDEHKLVQPVMLQRREDKLPSECTLDQLQYTCRDVIEVKRTYRWKAINRRGNHMDGVTDEVPLDFVMARFKRRWRFLELLDEMGTAVGGITVEDGVRKWWGEAS